MECDDREADWKGRRHADQAVRAYALPLIGMVVPLWGQAMSEILVRFDEAVTDPSGVRYFPQVVGRERSDGLWEGWIEFVSAADKRSIESGRETTQPNRTDLKYWAEGLTRAYLQGALGRSQSPTEAIRRDRTAREAPRESPRAF